MNKFNMFVTAVCVLFLILLSYFRDSGKQNVLSVNRDPLYFRFVPEPETLPPPPERPSTNTI